MVGQKKENRTADDGYLLNNKNLPRFTSPEQRRHENSFDELRKELKGGTEKWTRMAAETLSEEHEVFLAYRREIIGSRFTVKKYRLPCLSHIDLYTLFGLIQIIRKERIEVIIPTKRKDYLLAGLAAKACGITCILRLGIQRRLSIPVLHRLIYHTLPDGIIVNAKKIKQELLLSNFMEEEKIRVIYNGVDTGTLDRLGRPPAEKPCPFLVATAGARRTAKATIFSSGVFRVSSNSPPESTPG